MSEENTINISIGKNAAPWLKDFILSSIPQDGQTINVIDDREKVAEAQDASRWELNEHEALDKKRECFAHLVNAEPLPFIELHGFTDVEPGDPFVVPDEDGDCLFSQETYELRHNGSYIATRVLIHADTNLKTAIRLLKKHLEGLERMDEDSFNSAKPCAPSQKLEALDPPF